MGYYTNYTLKVCDNFATANDNNQYGGLFDDPGVTALEQAMLEDLYEIMYEEKWGECRYAPATLDSLISDESMKWYSHEMDLKELSAKYPNYYFVLYGDGEENGDVWRELYYKGKLVDGHNAELCYPNFVINESELS